MCDDIRQRVIEVSKRTEPTFNIDDPMWCETVDRVTHLIMQGMVEFDGDAGFRLTDKGWREQL